MHLYAYFLLPCAHARSSTMKTTMHTSALPSLTCPEAQNSLTAPSGRSSRRRSAADALPRGEALAIVDRRLRVELRLIFSFGLRLDPNLAAHGVRRHLRDELLDGPELHLQRAAAAGLFVLRVRVVRPALLAHAPLRVVAILPGGRQHAPELLRAPHRLLAAARLLALDVVAHDAVVRAHLVQHESVVAELEAPVGVLLAR
mmetsp:Transcript_35101/g.110488  ORF Transcript_35101/g.110488 Transcript_35101/m.110488 type:complete len:201 (+) Transcript_35101:26-628(+)